MNFYELYTGTLLKSQQNFISALSYGSYSHGTL
jgi:hypothetical protein